MQYFPPIQYYALHVEYCLHVGTHVDSILEVMLCLPFFNFKWLKFIVTECLTGVLGFLAVCICISICSQISELHCLGTMNASVPSPTYSAFLV